MQLFAEGALGILQERLPIHGQWSSPTVFVLASIGSAVGLGNLWKFPYLAGENGGGAFVLIYLLCIAVVGIPIMVSEVLIGRRGRLSPINSLARVAREAGGSPLWRLIGVSGIAAGMIILSFYSVIGGWALAYVVRTASGLFTGVTAKGSLSIFNALIRDPERLLAWHTLFSLATTLVVARGVRSGLEQAVRLLVPALFILLLVVVGYNLNSGYFMQSLQFLFFPDFQAITPGGVLQAMGHAFFTLSLGVGAMMVYGSYLPAGASIPRLALAVTLVDTLIAMLAGLAIFPLVFANGLEPGSGPGLVFSTLPIAFGHLPGGGYVGTLFFLLLVLAALTSAISLMEPMVAWLVEDLRLRRPLSAAVSGFLVWLLGLVTLMSFSHWAFDFRFAGQLKHNGWFDILDIATSGIMLPLGGLAVVLFTGWVMSRQSLVQELGGKAGPGFWIWYVSTRYLAPLAVSVVFLQMMGVIRFAGSS